MSKRQTQKKERQAKPPDTAAKPDLMLLREAAQKAHGVCLPVSLSIKPKYLPPDDPWVCRPRTPFTRRVRGFDWSQDSQCHCQDKLTDEAADTITLSCMEQKKMIKMSIISLSPTTERRQMLDCCGWRDLRLLFFFFQPTAPSGPQAAVS